MRNKLLLICMLLLGACAKDATPPATAPTPKTLSFRVPEEEALRQLDNVLDILDTPTRGGKRTVKEIFEHRSARTRSTDGSTPNSLLYIVNFDDDQGYAVLAADSRLEPVLALIDSGVYTPSENYAEEPDLTEADLDEDEKDEFWCIGSNGPLTGTFRTIELIEDYADGFANPPYTIQKYGELVRQKQVGPYIQTKWGQRKPFNGMCNDDYFSYKSQDNYTAGCVAVALAQILAYHRNPQSAYGHTYDWDKITGFTCNYPNAPQDVIFEVAHLVKAAGEACRTKYGEENSGSTAYRAKKALKYTFDYYGTHRHLSFAAKDIRNMLDNNSPVLIAGKPKRKLSGHAWVIDGYIYGYRKIITEIYEDENYTKLKSTTEDNASPTYYYHCNFGWSGDADGYYLGKVFDTVAGRADVENNLDPGTNYSEHDYRWHFRTVTYNNPNK